jgi:hypothetical protein
MSDAGYGQGGTRCGRRRTGVGMIGQGFVTERPDGCGMGADRADDPAGEAGAKCSVNVREVINGPFLGSRRMTAMLRADGLSVNDPASNQPGTTFRWSSPRGPLHLPAGIRGSLMGTSGLSFSEKWFSCILHYCIAKIAYAPWQMKSRSFHTDNPRKIWNHSLYGIKAVPRSDRSSRQMLSTLSRSRSRLY